jgi:outer membrane cobalamin receptor
MKCLLTLFLTQRTQRFRKERYYKIFANFAINLACLAVYCFNSLCLRAFALSRPLLQTPPPTPPHKGGAKNLLHSRFRAFCIFNSKFKIQNSKLFFSAFCLLLSATSYAQSEVADTIRHYELEGVTVVGHQYKEIIPAQKLSGEQLQRLNSHSVADAIRYFSGVQIKDYGGIGGLKTVDIRCMGTNHLGVFYDGVQLGNAQNGQIDLGKFSLDNIDGVSLYNGQKSEIFQPAKDFGSAGTIYLRTRRPKFEDNKTTNIRALFRTGSFDLINPSLLWEQKISSKMSSSLNAEYINSSGKYKFRYRRVLADGSVAWDTTAVRQNGDIEAFRLEGGVNGSYQKTIWNAKAYFYNSERGIPGAIVNNVWKRSQRQWDKNFFTQASMTSTPSQRYEMMANVKYANDYMRYLNPDTSLMYINNRFWQQEIYGSLANKFTIIDNWDISLSTDFQWNTLDASLTNFVKPQRYTALTALATAFEVWTVKMQASLLGTFVHEQAEPHPQPLPTREWQQSAPDKQEYTPAIFLSWQPFQGIKHLKSLHVRAFYKKIFRMPTFNDLYYTDIGNALLKPEYVTQYNIGAIYAVESRVAEAAPLLRISADVYYNEVTDKIVAIPKGDGQYRWMMMNIGYVEIRGIDIKTETNFVLPYGINLQTTVNYTHQKAQDFSNPKDNDPKSGSYGGQIAYIPWDNGSLSLMANYKSWNFNYSFIYVGERYHNSANIRKNYEQPWYTSDVSAGKEFRFRGSGKTLASASVFKISTEINNIFNQQYDVILHYPMPGTNFKVILNYEL